MHQYKSYLIMTKTKRGGGGSRLLLDNVQKKDAFLFWMSSLRADYLTIDMTFDTSATDTPGM